MAITSPTQGAVFTVPVTVTIEASAFDSDGGVQQVAFFANGALIGTDATSPYSVNWFPATGSYTLTAVATDTHGATTTSARWAP